MSYFNWIVQRFKDNPAGAALAGPLNSPAAYMLKLDSLADSVGPQMLQSWLNKESGAGMTQQQIEQNAYTAQREDTQYQRGVEDMKAAGLNPALMLGHSAQPAPSSPSSSSSAGGSLSNMLELLALPLQLKQIEAQTEDLRASAAEKRSSASLNEQLRLFNEEINPLRIEAQQVSNNLGRTNERKINAECDKIAEEMNKIAAETETEVTKQLYNIAAANLADAQAYQIVQMLPYSIELTKAQTQQAKAIARLNFVQAAYQNKLLSEGFVDALISFKESDAAMQAVKEHIKTGKAFQIDDDSTLAKAWNAFAEASGLSRGVQVIDYILDKINVFAPLVSKGAGVSAAAASSVHDPFGYMAGE